MSTLLLVPGAGLAGEAWRDVVTDLHDRGHDARPVTLRGLGTRREEATPETDLEDHVEDVVEAAAGLDDVVLVGHSYAATVVWEALPRLVERVRHVVLLAAVPSPGRTLLDVLGPEATAQVTMLADEHGDGWMVPPFPRVVVDEAWGDHDFDDDTWARYLEVAGGHPLATLRSTPTVPLDADVPVRRTHVAAAGDPGEPPPLPAGWQRRTIDTGHWAMLTAPRRLAAMLADLAC